jgi:Putative Na+/H+ antiporter
MAASRERCGGRDDLSQCEPMRPLGRSRSPTVPAALGVAVALLLLADSALAAAPASGALEATPFPPPLESYADAHLESVWDILRHRVAEEPFNLVATLLFFGAVIHTFLTHRFRHIAHELEVRTERRLRDLGDVGPHQPRVSAAARLFHFLGEVEAVFGIWIVPLLLSLAALKGRGPALSYIEHGVNFTEPVFVVAVMAIASTRPILELAERALQLLARLGGETPRAWWLVLLTAGPLLGSFITEPAAMTICASLLSRRFYALRPSAILAYATLGLLFVSISVGGTLTHFAAPPVLMVAGAWGWDTPFMLEHLGWKAATAIALAAAGYLLVFRRELAALSLKQPVLGEGQVAGPAIPLWVTAIHVAFLLFTVWNAHHARLLILGLLFFLAVVEVTQDFQRDFSLRPPILVGFFLAGLVVHGGLQQWWIEPVLGRLAELPLMLGATALTAFNDNAAITYLATLVPTLTDGMKYAVVAGAVAGGGLTVIANAPNPAGQAILNEHFEEGIGALGLLAGALAPTVVALVCFAMLA